jgi:hypothetical protein
MKDRIDKLIKMTMDTCLPWVSIQADKSRFIDPLDKEEISAHYGATHMAAALIMYGKHIQDEELIYKGESLLSGILDQWDESKTLPDFHNDFNNFALCVIDSCSSNNTDLIRKKVLETADTSFDTVNWLPMRWYVNRCRYEWTGNNEYKDLCVSCMEKIKQATYADGFIDDMLPLGRSFSLQYNVATVAFLQFLRVRNESLDLSAELGALLNAVCPDGDINYLGRGTNQIFGWGLWIYLLASSEQMELGRALDYLEEHLPVMLANNNIMLNDNPGSEKYMWWDYHYCSVYTAHLFLWLVLALRDYGKMAIEPVLSTGTDSGVHVYRNNEAFAVVFDGRTEYPAEAGPSVAAIWTKTSGAIHKGVFGPWYGLFGNKYINPDTSIRNFLGLYNLAPRKNRVRVLEILRKNNHNTMELTEKPSFIVPNVELSNTVKISYSVSELPCVLNIPISCGDVSVKNNGAEMRTTEAMKIKNQYGWVTVKQVLIESGNTIEIEFK